MDRYGNLESTKAALGICVRSPGDSSAGGLLAFSGAPWKIKIGVSFSDLGLKGCTLYYRRRNVDMPLSYMYPDPTPEQVEKAHNVRKRILINKGS